LHRGDGGAFAGREVERDLHRWHEWAVDGVHRDVEQVGKEEYHLVRAAEAGQRLVRVLRGTTILLRLRGAATILLKLDEPARTRADCSRRGELDDALLS
jgi:hypothetical protein